MPVATEDIITQSDPLISLGLVTADEVRRAAGGSTAIPDEGAAATPDAAAAATAATAAPKQSAQRGEYATAIAAAKATYDRQLADIERDDPRIDAALKARMGEKTDPEVIATVKGLVKDNARILAQLELERGTSALAVRRSVADILAEEHSVGNVTVTAAELLKEPTLEAMQARADALLQERRNAKSADRKATGADKAEAGAAAGAVDSKAIESLSGVDLIRLGITRGEKGNVR